MTRLRFVVILATLALLGAIYVLFRPAPTRSRAATSPAHAIPPAKPATTQTAEPETAPPPRHLKRGPLKIAKGQPIPEVFPHQAERQSIQRMADTYDAKNIPAIAVYLNHTDDTVRTAARMALVQIGDAAAVPYLEAAARQNHGEEETEALNEAISFLKLPVMTLPAAPAVTP